MILKAWLTVNSRGQARLSKGKPGLAMNEVSIYLTLTIPDALFAKPRLEASVTIPDSVIPSDTIDATVLDNVKEAIEGATGLRVQLTVGAPLEKQ